MALASLHPLGPLASLPRTRHGSRIQRPIERRADQTRPALQLKCMSIQEQLKPPSQELTTSRRDTVVFMTGLSLAANILLSADPAEALVKTASIGQQILDKLEVFKEIFGLSKPKSKDAEDKEKAPSPSAKEKTSLVKEEKPQQPPTPSAKEKASLAKVEKAQTKEGEKTQQPSTTSKEETPKPPSPLNDSPKPLVDAILPI